MKMNSLVDPRCIQALYEASRAGVRVDLNVRGICCLRPGVPGVSENIRVVSVVGRFLEHSRIYGFHRGSQRHYWIGSGDLMPRNLDTRVELLTPIEDESLKREIELTLERCLADDSFAWELTPETPVRRSGGERSVHRELVERAASRAATEGWFRIPAPGGRCRGRLCGQGGGAGRRRLADPGLAQPATSSSSPKPSAGPSAPCP